MQRYAPPADPCKTNPDCINVGPVSLFKNVRTGLIDPDTPNSVKMKKAADGTDLKLVVCLMCLYLAGNVKLKLGHSFLMSSIPMDAPSILGMIHFLQQ